MARRRAFTAMAVAAASVLALVGCSIDVGGSPDPSLGDDTMLIAADSGSPTFVQNWNPYAYNKRIGASYMYEPLLQVSPLDSAIVPWLASAYEQPDARTIVMTIRPGVTWSDGEYLTVDDVAFSFALLQDHPSLDTYGAWTHIDSVETAEDTVTFRLLTDDVPALIDIGKTLIVPEHVWTDVDDPETFVNEDPIGSGPYTLGQYSPQQYSMDKNPDYWQADKVAAEHLVLPASNTNLDIVAKGYDWAYSYISDVKGTWGAANPGNRWWFPAGGVIGLIPNLTKAPWNDVNFRQGISHALDRGQVADAATEGYTESAGQTGLLLPNQQDQLDPTIPNGGDVAQDTAAALDYFAQAGFTQDGDRLVDASGSQLRITITTANGYADWLRAVQEIQRQLGDIGIDVKVESPQPAGYYAAQANGDFEVELGAFGSGNVYQAYNTLLSSDFYVEVGEAAVWNYERYSNPAVDELLTSYKSTTDESAQLKISHQLQNVMMTEAPVIGIYYGGLWGLFNDNKFTGWPSDDDPYTSPQTYESSPLLVLTSLKRAS